MFRKKCPSCAKKIEGKFNFCPYCGESFKKVQENEKYGMLGRDDTLDLAGPEMKLPFGLNKIMDSLMKQLEKQMNEMASADGKMPKGFRIKIASGNPNAKQVAVDKKTKMINYFTEEQLKELSLLPKEEASSQIRRLSDRIIYELEAPGINSPKQVIVAPLASGFEIKAYSKDKCYTKFIPFAPEIIQYYVKYGKVVFELKN